MKPKYKGQFDLAPGKLNCSFGTLMNRIFFHSHAKEAKVVSALILARLAGANLKEVLGLDGRPYIAGTFPADEDRFMVKKVILDNKLCALKRLGVVYE